MYDNIFFPGSLSSQYQVQVRPCQFSIFIISTGHIRYPSDNSQLRSAAQCLIEWHGDDSTRLDGSVHVIEKAIFTSVLRMRPVKKSPTGDFTPKEPLIGFTSLYWSTSLAICPSFTPFRNIVIPMVYTFRVTC